MEKYYQLGTYTESQWDELHKEMTAEGTEAATVPDRSICCIDDQLHSKTRGTYLLTEEEAEKLKKDPRIKFLNIDYKSYPRIYKPPPEDLHDTPVEVQNRWTGPVKNIRRITGLTTGDTDINRTGYQLLRCQQFLDPWVGVYSDNTNISSNISYYGTGKHVDAIVGDDGTWFGHPEFCNNPVKVSNGDSIETPNDYVGGNVLPGNGYCDLLDLVLDSPYYLDPDWFDADPDNRLTTRWDGTVVPVESVAKAWWSNSSQRSAQFASAGTVFISSQYTRNNCNGSNTARSLEGDHGTPCAALVYGRTQGWAYNANKWAFDLYGIYGVSIEPGFDLVKIFQQLKPVNPIYGNKNPTLMSNSWGYRSNKDPSGTTYYYTHRTSSNIPYTSESGIRWLSHMGLTGDNGRWRSEMKPNSLTAAQDELIASGVIFVNSAGNSNQKQVSSDHPDFNNYITQTNGGSLEDSEFDEFGIPVFGTTNRIGFPGQGGMYEENGQRIYPCIGIGALSDSFISGVEGKVNYSNRGNGVDVYAPADGTLAANRGSTPVGNRVDTYPGYRQLINPEIIDSGFSAVCDTNSVLTGGDFKPAGNSAYSIVTSLGTATITSIALNLQNITANPDTTPTASDPSYEYDDEAYWTVGIPWSISFNGSTYNEVHVGSNSYLTFIAGSLAGFNPSPSAFSPALPKILVSAGDLSCQRIYTETIGSAPNRLFVIRYQGHTSYQNGILGSPTMEYEYHFYENDNDKIELHVNLNPRVAVQTVTAPTVATDRSFNGTSAACPVAAGFISTVLEYNRTWGWQDVKNWINTLDVQTPDRFYYGTESADPTTLNWNDYESLEGGEARVLYQDPSVYNIIEIPSVVPPIRSKISGSFVLKNGIQLRRR